MTLVWDDLHVHSVSLNGISWEQPLNLYVEFNQGTAMVEETQQKIQIVSSGSWIPPLSPNCFIKCENRVAAAAAMEM